MGFRMRLLVVVLLPFWFGKAALAEDIDDSAKPCLPESFTDAHLRAQHTSEGTTYLFVGGKFDFSFGNEYATSFISLENETCELLIGPDDFETNFFDVVDFEVEKELHRGNLEYVIAQVGNQERVQELMFEEAQLDVIVERSDAEVRAMEELGFEVPPFYNSITNDPAIGELILVYQNSQLVPTPKFINNVRVADTFSIAQ